MLDPTAFSTGLVRVIVSSRVSFRLPFSLSGVNFARGGSATYLPFYQGIRTSPYPERALFCAISKHETSTSDIGSRWWVHGCGFRGIDPRNIRYDVYKKSPQKVGPCLLRKVPVLPCTWFIQFQAMKYYYSISITRLSKAVKFETRLQASSQLWGPIPVKLQKHD